MADKKIISQEDIMAFLDSAYNKCKDGIPYVSKSVSQMADDYLSKHDDKDDAIKDMINKQIIKCTTSGFVTGFGGFITMPVAIPANISSVLYVQMRMIACTAYMSGYDLSSDQVQTFVYACLAGVSVNEVLKKFGVQLGEKLAVRGIQKIPIQVIRKINQRIGMRFLTKFGEKGLINLGKTVPVVGAAINGGFDYAETKLIANRAYKWFVEGDTTTEDLPKVDEEDLSEETIEKRISYDEAMQDSDVVRAIKMAGEKYKDEFRVVSIGNSNEYKMITLTSDEVDKFGDGFDCPWLLINKETGEDLLGDGAILDPIGGFEDFKMEDLQFVIVDKL